MKIRRSLVFTRVSISLLNNLFLVWLLGEEYSLITLRKKSLYSELFEFSRIWTEYGDFLCNLPIQSECGKIRARKTPNTDISCSDNVKQVQVLHTAITLIVYLNLCQTLSRDFLKENFQV